MATPIGEFIKWLPGELEYSVRMTAYDVEIEQARLPLNDPRSIYGLLQQAWSNFQRMRLLGNNHQPLHAMSAQLQLAKFASGLFDKSAMGIWFENGCEISDEAFNGATTLTAELVNMHRPWQNLQANDDYFERIMHKQFGDTIFGRNIPTLVKSICEAADNPDNNVVIVDRLITQARSLGGVAVGCYEVFARNELIIDEYTLPLSVPA